MPPPREQLTLDPFRNGIDNPFQVPHARGFLITKPKMAAGFLAFLVLLAGVAFGTYYLTKQQIMEGPEPGMEETGHLKKVLNVRLPDSIIPIYYKLEIIPFLEPAKNFSVQGKVWIDVQCVKETSQITLHIRNITVHKNTVTVTRVIEAELPVSKAFDIEQQTSAASENNVRVEGQEFDEDRDFYKLGVGSQLTVGAFYRIFMEYTGVMGNTMDGFYRSSYTDSNQTKFIGVTQFESTDARQAFPCFDEPALKAKFEVSIARRSNMSSISNMDLMRTEAIPDMEGWVWDHYKKSVPMSTYLVAWVVSDFESRLSDRSLSKPEFRVWARKSASLQTEYARDIGPRILTFFENYFGIDYPLPKLDMIAIPDFSAGAMENWGLVTFRENSMLFDKDGSSDDNKRFISMCVAHEISHQWFGNLVTPKWWSDVWLNEGFAQYMEFIAVDNLSPDWKMLEHIVSIGVQEALSLDALDSSHPISVSVGNPDEINAIFDHISYRKGSSIIRMLHHALSDDTFKAGLTNYLKKWSYMAVDQDDLWTSLTQQAHVDKILPSSVTVSEVMKTWTLQKGFPVISVHRNYEDGSVTLTQQKFQASPNATNDYQSYRWWVPISYASKIENANFHNTTPVLWLSKEESSLTTTNISAHPGSWLIVNVQQTGYYRVNYDDKNWQLITAQLLTSHGTIHTVNRAQLLVDAFNLAKAGQLDYRVAFRMTLYLEEETEYLPWETFRQPIMLIAHMLSRSSSYGALKSFVQDLLEGQYKRVGFSETAPETFLMRQHRTIVVRMACELDHPDCVEKAGDLFSLWMNSTEPEKTNPFPTNIRKYLYCAAIHRGGEKEWNFLWERYLKTNVAAEREFTLFGLACSRDEWILNRYLSWTITEGSGIRKQDAPIIFRSVALQNVASYLNFQFIRHNWLKIKEYLGSGLLIASILKFAATKLNTPSELAELQQFKVQYQCHLGAAARNVDQAIESVVDNVRWMESNYKTVSTWLEHQMVEDRK